MNTNDQLLVSRELLEAFNRGYCAPPQWALLRLRELLAAQPAAVEPVGYRYKEAQASHEYPKPWELASVELGLIYLERKRLAISEHYLGMEIEPLFTHPPRDVAANDWETLAGQVFELGHRYWKAAVAERGRGAVQWLRNEETGATFVFTRGEYSEELIGFLNTLPYAQQQPSNVAAGGVVLPEHGKHLVNYDLGFMDGWNACLDEVARLNALDSKTTPQ